MISTSSVRTVLIVAFDRADIRVLLAALEQLQARLDAGEATPAPHGVCSALSRIIEDGDRLVDAYKFVRIAVEDWPEAIRDGDGMVDLYPVSTTGGFWVGENRAARIRLIAHLTRHCEALLAEALLHSAQGVSLKKRPVC